MRKWHAFCYRDRRQIQKVPIKKEENESWENEEILAPNRNSVTLK